MFGLMNKDRLDFGNERIGRLFRMMFFPTLIAMFSNSLLNICDGMFVGHGVGPEALAAINIVAPMFLLTTGIGLMFGIGASVIASIRLSEGNVRNARTIMTQAYLAGAVIFGAIILLTLLYTRPLLYLVGCSPALEDPATDYLLWLLPGFFFFYLQCVGMMLVRLDGSPKFAMGIQIATAVCNIFLDWLMVFPLQWGIAGASIATSISCVVGGSLVLVYFLRYSDKLKFIRLDLSRKSLSGLLRNVSHMARIGFATFIAELALGIMIVTGNYMFISMLGEDGVAAYSVGCYLFPLIFSVSNAVAQSAQPIVSFNYGAGRMDRVTQALRISLMTGAICGAVVSLLMWVGSPLLTAIFLPSDTPSFSYAVHGLPLLGLSAVFFALNIVMIGYYQSLEKAAGSTIYMILRGIIFLVPSFIILPGLIGTDGLWLAIPAAEVLTLLVIAATYPRLNAVTFHRSQHGTVE